MVSKKLLPKMIKKIQKVKYSYKPKQIVIDKLKEILLYEKEKIKNSNKSKLTTTEKRERGRINKSKTDLLDRAIFPSMANITYFFEYIEKNKILLNLFDKDIKELLGIVNQHRNEEYAKDDKGKDPTFRTSFVFGRFISSLCDPELLIISSIKNFQKNQYNDINQLKINKKKNKINIHIDRSIIFENNYRFILLEYMQNLIRRNINMFFTTEDFSPVSPYSDNIHKMIIEDIDRVIAWMQLFSNPAKKNLYGELEAIDKNSNLSNKHPHRKVDF